MTKRNLVSIKQKNSDKIKVEILFLTLKFVLAIVMVISIESIKNDSVKLN